VSTSSSTHRTSDADTASRQLSSCVAKVSGFPCSEHTIARLLLRNHSPGARAARSYLCATPAKIGSNIFARDV
jgi:hypothetical protein